MVEVDYQGSIYIPPKVAVIVSALLRKPREVGHSVKFSDLFSSVQEERRAYFDGLSVVPVILFSLFLAWGFITTLLKWKGAEVGCASGRAFISLHSDDENSEVDKEKPEDDDDLASTSESSNAETISESSVKPLFLGNGGEMMKNSDSYINDDNDHFGAKMLRWMRRKNEQVGTDDTGINRLGRRTRFSYLIFASLALVCAPFNLFLSFGPLREVAMEISTTEDPYGLLLEVQNVIEKVETSLTTIESLSADALEFIMTVPTDLDAICPLVNITDLESMIGVDLTEIVDTIIEQQFSLEEDIAGQLSSRQSFVDGIEDGMPTFEKYADESEKFIWILPGLLLTIIGTTVISIVGVILAWKEKSGTRFQRVLSYVVLPILILIAIICWIVLMIFSLSTTVGTDFCLSGSSNGSPDQTIQEILANVGNETESTAHYFASTYVVDNCEGIDPTQDIYEIKLETQKHIDNIWRQISKIDSVGRVMAIERCGGTEEFVEMLSGARDLAMTLTDIRRSISSLEKSTGCSSIHPIYTEAVHDIICTQTLSASGYGFVTFLIMWICLMAMISLRASWLRNNTEEGKVYHDENEVAENMVVDEHEEYLAYISKYKHEWQEYEGIEEDRVVSPRSEFRDNHRLGSSEDSDQDYYYGDDEEEIVFSASKSDLSTLDSKSLYCMECKPQQERPTVYQRQLTSREIMDHQDDGVSYASGEISFASLSSAIKSDVLNLNNILILPPPMNPDYSNDAPQEQPDLDAIANRNDKSDLDFNPDFENNLSEDLQINGEEFEVQIKDL